MEKKKVFSWLNTGYCEAKDQQPKLLYYPPCCEKVAQDALEELGETLADPSNWGLRHDDTLGDAASEGWRRRKKRSRRRKKSTSGKCRPCSGKGAKKKQKKSGKKKASKKKRKKKASK